MTVKTDGEEFTGLEIQEESADMARRSVVHNHLEDKITIKTGDIKEAADYFPAASFDVITTNPLYDREAWDSECQQCQDDRRHGGTLYFG